ncbi:copper homeostasis protein CutC [Malacoplasma iowae]|uniref:copper homeostasis protein CutC n=1 Tax=Malacoplasma iowae TaxID=2116 RepID=UPI00022C644F|nr:copper homeostasis protein CutC [Malacoplasma iowae]EGZ31280.1 copper homeostasis protein [Malacoplasma iowae 695]
MKHLIKEFCIGSIDDVMKIKEKNKKEFHRFETCSHLEFGGYTPTEETFNFIKNNYKEHSQVVMIRNTESFVLKDENKINQLIYDIKKFLNLGAKSFIFGYINDDYEIDQKLCLKLINEIKKVEGTSYCFHMAIDEVVNYNTAFETLIKLGFKRVLTKGGKTQAIDNIDRLKKMQELYGDKIEIIVGGKVDFNNYKLIHKETDILQFHGRKIINTSQN